MEHNHRFPDGERIKMHFRKNKKLYLGIGIGVVVTLAIRKPIVLAPIFNNNNIPVFHNNQINFAGHMTKLVKCLETGQLWETVTEAAGAVGHTVQTMSKHLNGHTEHIDGLHYAIVGMGTTG